MNEEALSMEPTISEPDISSNEKFIALLCHLSIIATVFVGPLALWLLKRDESEYVDYHGREALNFSVSLILAAIACSILLGIISFILIWIPLVNLLVPILWVMSIPLFAIASTLMLITAAIKANSGLKCSYPLCLRLID